MRRVRCLIALMVGLATLWIGERSGYAQRCDLSTTSVAFGSYDVFSPVPLTSTGTVSYRCIVHPGHPISITIWMSKGSNAPNNTPRQMASGSYRLNYNLYLDAGHTQIWGDPDPSQYGPVVLKSAPSSISGTIAIYALIAAGQDVPAGNYTDNVAVTFNF